MRGKMVVANDKSQSTRDRSRGLHTFSRALAAARNPRGVNSARPRDERRRGRISRAEIALNSRIRGFPPVISAVGGHSGRPNLISAGSTPPLLLPVPPRAVPSPALFEQFDSRLEK